MEVPHAATNAAAVPYQSAALLNKYAGTKFKLITGYPASAQMVMALEKGETYSATASWESIKTGRMDLIRDGKVAVIYQISIARLPDLPDVPTLVELAQSDIGRSAMQFFASSAEVGRSYVAAPGTPADRVKALRVAFNAMMKDPVLVAEIKQRGIEFNPATAEEMEKIVKDALSTPKEILAELRDVLIQ